MKCEKCGFDNDEHDQFCRSCGAPLIKVNVGITCPNCGHINRSSANHCTECGYNLETNTPYEENRTPVKKNSKLPIILICAGLFIGGSIGSFMYVQKSSNKKPKDYASLVSGANDYLNNLDYDKATAYYLDAIKIDPKQVEPYVQLSTIYTVQDDFDKAYEILDQAEENAEDTNNELITAREKVDEAHDYYLQKMMYQAYSDTLEDLEKEYGEIEIVEEKDLDDYYHYSGVLFAKLLDMNNDGIEELIVYSRDEKEEHFILNVFVYDKENEEVISNEYIDDENIYDYDYLNHDKNIIIKECDNSYNIGYGYFGDEYGFVNLFDLDENNNLECLTKLSFDHENSEFVFKENDQTISFEVYNQYFENITTYQTMGDKEYIDQDFNNYSSSAIIGCKGILEDTKDTISYNISKYSCLQKIASDPEKIDNYLDLVDVYIEYNKYDEAIQCLDDAKAKFGDTTEIEDKYTEIDDAKKKHVNKTMYEKYLTILENLIDYHGECQAITGSVADDYPFDGHTYSGLLYAELIDLNNDGIEEMIACYRDSDTTEIAEWDNTTTITVYSYDIEKEETAAYTYDCIDGSYLNTYTEGAYVITLKIASQDDQYYLVESFVNDDTHNYRYYRFEEGNLRSTNLSNPTDYEEYLLYYDDNASKTSQYLDITDTVQNTLDTLQDSINEEQD